MAQAEKSQWVREMKRYEQASDGRAVWQLANTFIPFAGLFTLMILMVEAGVPYIATLGIAVLTGVFLVRLFMFFHDACHGSFFRSARANRIVGRLIGVLAFTSYDDFRHSHGIHHATAGNLDRRGIGDVWTMTVTEYLDASRRQRLTYRLYRHPFIMFVLGPIFTFLIRNRIPPVGGGRKRFLGVILTDMGLVLLALGLSLGFGWRTYLLVQLPVILIAGTMGIWLFYVQHQFDPAYWARQEEWGSVDAALIGSSHYKLPPVLRWATANIGFHHIHHLRPRIPNYNLQTCYRDVEEVRVEHPLTIRRSFGSLKMNLWDEAAGALISFGQLAKRMAAG